MKKNNMELVAWLMKKMENGKSQIEYYKRSVEQENREAEDNGTEVSETSYYRQQLETELKEYEMLVQVFELI